MRKGITGALAASEVGKHDIWNVPDIREENDISEDSSVSETSNHPRMDKDPCLGVGGNTVNTTIRIRKKTAMALKKKAITQRETYDEIITRLVSL